MLILTKSIYYERIKIKAEFIVELTKRQENLMFLLLMIYLKDLASIILCLVSKKFKINLKVTYLVLYLNMVIPNLLCLHAGPMGPA